MDKKIAKIHEQYTQLRDYVSAILSFSKAQGENATYDRELEIRIRDARRHLASLVLIANKAGAKELVDQLVKLTQALDLIDEAVRV